MGLNWREILRNWSQQCPQCGKKWLVMGAREGDQHICKSCGEHFRIQRQRLKRHDARERGRSSGTALAKETTN